MTNAENEFYNPSMNVNNNTFSRATVGLKITSQENEALKTMLARTGLKKEGYVRNLVLADLKKNGWLPQSQEENYAQGASK